MNNTITVAQVLHPDTGKVLAFEIVANDGTVFFAALDPFWEGLRAGPYPNDKSGAPLERVEVARLE